MVFDYCLKKIRQHSWKERLKISIVAKFESDLVKTNQDMAPQSRTLVWWGVGQDSAPTIQTSVTSVNVRTFARF